MSQNNLIGARRRELTREEQSQIYVAQQKWYPQLFQTYNTTLLEMMASPLKKAIIDVSISAVVLIIGFLIGNKYLDMNINVNIGIVVIIVLSLFTAYGSYVGQWKENDNLVLMVSLSHPNATKYDYESSPVIQAKLMRQAYSEGGGGGGSLSDSAMGAGLGYYMGSKASKRRGGGRRR
jgi:hypothetical protein